MHMYDTIADALVDFDANMTVVFTCNLLATLCRQLPRIVHGLTALRDNQLITHLYAIMAVNHSPKLLVKSSILLMWIQQLSLADTVRVHIGFVSMHSHAAFHELRTLPLMPCAFTQTEVHMHPTFDSATSACVPGTHPLMCAYHSPHTPTHVHASYVLPLGL